MSDVNLRGPTATLLLPPRPRLSFCSQEDKAHFFLLNGLNFLC